MTIKNNKINKNKPTLISMAVLSLLSPAWAGALANVGGFVNSPNAPTIFKIANPNANGLSMNNMDKFNVSKEGMVVNNSKDSVYSNLFGAQIKGNAKLSSTASTILVDTFNGSNPSNLNGTLELAGSSAKFILANPYGINCSGCSFINFNNEVMLVAGQSNVNGNQIGFKNIRAGINVDSGGMSSDQGTSVNMRAQKISISGNVNLRGQLTLNSQSVDSYGNRMESIPGDIQLTGTAMHATRITLRAAAANSNVKVTEGLYGINGVNIKTGGTVDVQRELRSRDGGIDISAAGNVNVYGPSMTAGNDINLNGNNVNIYGYSNQELKADNINISSANDTLINNSKINSDLGTNIWSGRYLVIANGSHIAAQAGANLIGLNYISIDNSKINAGGISLWGYNLGVNRSDILLNNFGSFTAHADNDFNVVDSSIKGALNMNLDGSTFNIDNSSLFSSGAVSINASNYVRLYNDNIQNIGARSVANIYAANGILIENTNINAVSAHIWSHSDIRLKQSKIASRTDTNIWSGRFLTVSNGSHIAVKSSANLTGLNYVTVDNSKINADNINLWGYNLGLNRSDLHLNFGKFTAHADNDFNVAGSSIRWASNIKLEGSQFHVRDSSLLSFSDTNVNSNNSVNIVNSSLESYKKVGVTSHNDINLDKIIVSSDETAIASKYGHVALSGNVVAGKNISISANKDLILTAPNLTALGNISLHAGWSSYFYQGQYFARDNINVYATNLYTYAKKGSGTNFVSDPWKTDITNTFLANYAVALNLNLGISDSGLGPAGTVKPEDAANPNTATQAYLNAASSTVNTKDSWLFKYINKIKLSHKAEWTEEVDRTSFIAGNDVHRAAANIMEDQATEIKAGGSIHQLATYIKVEPFKTKITELTTDITSTNTIETGISSGIGVYGQLSSANSVKFEVGGGTKDVGVSYTAAKDFSSWSHISTNFLGSLDAQRNIDIGGRYVNIAAKQTSESLVNVLGGFDLLVKGSAALFDGIGVGAKVSGTVGFGIGKYTYDEGSTLTSGGHLKVMAHKINGTGGTLTLSGTDLLSKDTLTLFGGDYLGYYALAKQRTEDELKGTLSIAGGGQIGALGSSIGVGAEVKAVYTHKSQSAETTGSISAINAIDLISGTSLYLAAPEIESEDSHVNLASKAGGITFAHLNNQTDTISAAFNMGGTVALKLDWENKISIPGTLFASGTLAYTNINTKKIGSIKAKESVVIQSTGGDINMYGTDITAKNLWMSSSRHLHYHAARSEGWGGAVGLGAEVGLALKVDGVGVGLTGKFSGEVSHAITEQRAALKISNDVDLISGANTLLHGTLIDAKNRANIYAGGSLYMTKAVVVYDSLKASITPNIGLNFGFPTPPTNVPSVLPTFGIKVDAGGQTLVNNYYSEVSANTVNVSTGDMVVLDGGIIEGTNNPLVAARNGIYAYNHWNYAVKGAVNMNFNFGNKIGANSVPVVGDLGMMTATVPELTLIDDIDSYEWLDPTKVTWYGLGANISVAGGVSPTTVAVGFGAGLYISPMAQAFSGVRRR